jgi:hypothetical protein
LQGREPRSDETFDRRDLGVICLYGEHEA